MSRTSTYLTISCLVTVLLFCSSAFRVAAEEPAAKPADKKVDPSSPNSWPAGVVIFQQTDDAKKIRAALEQPVEFEFLDTPLGDVAKFVEKNSGITVEFDTGALAADGKWFDLPITKAGKFSSLCNGLELLLDGHGLTYLVKNDVLLITTKTAASAPENLSTRIYQVHDLVVAANDPTAASPDFDSLIDLITSTIRQQDWQDNGGLVGFIHSYRGPGILALVATHDESGHREIELLLKMLRESRVPQIVDAQAKQPFQPKESGMGGISGGIGGAVGGGGTPTVVPASSVPVPTSRQPGSGAGFF